MSDGVVAGDASWQDAEVACESCPISVSGTTCNWPITPQRSTVRLKAMLRKAAERTVEGLRAAIGRLVDANTPDECATLFAAAG